MPDNDDFDFGALARHAQQAESGMAAVQDDLQYMEATGYGREGLVAATLSAEGRLVGLTIDPSVIDPDDPETLVDLIMTAVDGAFQELSVQRNERMASVVDNLNGVLAGLEGSRRPGGTVAPRFPARRRAPGQEH
ncbi:YbaB/EbfC family nucleoid-associated protein [Streptomyces sp. NBC_01476]|uniref:YbaB/EbfC family nucleoid-associated protein n=1 Tax=Streptomyces sp. NBC_01476 TaxID=2903881 RepID=UPI002E34085A|nr:YbaB/EbfC family nucleoid-associated protein [Streptomyces sp. NBC_01476]